MNIFLPVPLQEFNPPFFANGLVFDSSEPYFFLFSNSLFKVCLKTGNRTSPPQYKPLSTNIVHISTEVVFLFPRWGKFQLLPSKATPRLSPCSRYLQSPFLEHSGNKVVCPASFSSPTICSYDFPFSAPAISLALSYHENWFKEQPFLKTATVPLQGQ